MPQPAPVSPADAEKVRPCDAACAGARDAPRSALAPSTSSAADSSHEPSDALTWFGPCGSDAHVCTDVANPERLRSEAKYMRTWSTWGAIAVEDCVSISHSMRPASSA